MKAAPAPAQPPIATDRADQTFVGRRKELAAIRASLDAAANGHGRLDVVSGPAGIGKTRLTHEVAAIARERGFYVVRGSCWEGEGAPAYWPWSDVLRNHLGTEPGPMNAAADFSQLLETSAARARIPIRGIVDATKEAQQARFMLFDRFCELLAALALAQPMVVILDDAQFADIGSLLLLQFLAGRLSKASIALLVTSRDPISELTASATRHPWARHRVLTGLSRSEARTLLAAYVSGGPRRSDLDRLMHLTDGNPYFVKEVAHLIADGTRLWDRTEPVAWPASLLAVTLQPYHRLSAKCRALLEAASVVGREFDAEVTAHAARIPVPDALELLDEAVQQRVVAPLAPGRYQFVHALVREAVQDHLHPSHRTRLHETIGESYEELVAAGAPISVAILAHHFCNGLPITQRRHAAHYCISAGRAAHAAFAYEEAVFQFRRAQSLSGASLTASESCDLLLQLGAAEAGAGQWSQSRRTFEDAAAIARRTGNREQLANAALGFKGMLWGTNPVDGDAVDLLEEARIALQDASPSLQVELLSALSRSLYFSPDSRRAQDYSTQALEIASQLTDKRLAANALETHTLTLLRPGTAEDLLSSAATLLDVADDLRDPQLRFNARMFRQFGLLGMGRIAEADNELDLAAQISESTPYPRFRWQVALIRAERAALRGDLRSAERLSATAHDLGSRVHDATPIQYQLLQAFHRIQLCLDLSSWPTTLQSDISQLPSLAARVAQAWLLSRTSHKDLASEILHALSSDGFSCIPDNHLALYALCVLAEVSAALAEQGPARMLYDALIPYSSSYVVTAWGSVVDGSVSHYLGLLADTLHMQTAARTHLEDAVVANRRLAAPALTARSTFCLARMLLHTGKADDISAATSLARRAAGTFSSLDLREYARLANDLCDRTRVAPQPPPPPSPTLLDHPSILRRSGDYWALTFEGATTLLRSTLGLQYIATLLACPGTPVHVLDLISGGHPSPRILRDTADVLSDRAARDAYKHRLRELSAEMAEATSHHDLGRHERLQAEQESIYSELSRAFSLSGSPRRSGSSAERARISVRNRISSSLRAIRQENVPCAKFLERSISTGTYCLYDPIRPVRWQL